MKTRSTFNELEKETKAFFQKHLCNEPEFPTWSDEWAFVDGVPNTEKRGCYALFDADGHVLYVGLGIGKGDGLYEGAGIGLRINRLFRWTKQTNTKGQRIYESTNPEVDHIRTIGFPDDVFYLAAALEIYLLMKLDGLKNKVHHHPA